MRLAEIIKNYLLSQISELASDPDADQEITFSGPTTDIFEANTTFLGMDQLHLLCCKMLKQSLSIFVELKNEVSRDSAILYLPG